MTLPRHTNCRCSLTIDHMAISFHSGHQNGCTLQERVMKYKLEIPFKCLGYHVYLHPSGRHAASHGHGKFPVGDRQGIQGGAQLTIEQWRTQIIPLRCLLMQDSQEELYSIPVGNQCFTVSRVAWDSWPEPGRTETAGQEIRIHSVLACMLATERPTYLCFWLCVP